jgi:hypothetical protein
VEIVVGQMSVHPAVTFSDTLWNCIAAAICLGFREKFRRKHDGSDAVTRKAFIAPNLLAKHGLVAFLKMLAKSVPLVEKYRQALVDLAQAMSYAKQRQG